MTFFRRLLTLALPAPHSTSASSSATTAPTPDDESIAAIEAMYRAWARRADLRILDDDNGTDPHLVVRTRRKRPASFRIVGRIQGRDVVVDPGIDGKAPAFVIATVGVSLPDVKPLLVTRATPNVDAATARIRSFFSDRDLGPELRSISVSPRHLRMRLAAGAEPDLVDRGIYLVGTALRALYDSPAPRTGRTDTSVGSASQPRQSCVTTVPYPT